MWRYKSVLVIVAHPDDETLWAGGTILMHPETKWTVVTLCRRTDPDRAPKFQRVMKLLGASGNMGNLDDGPEQKPIAGVDVRIAILDLLNDFDTDLILTHSMSGEYTRHRRHEETGKAVKELWETGKLRSPELRTFAYDDNGGRQKVKAIKNADIFTILPLGIWKRKRNLITDVYGFSPDSFEAKSTLQAEAFWQIKPNVEYLTSSHKI